jgi:uncharacterized protein YutE (UPF0331/DUF86 family)
VVDEGRVARLLRALDERADRLDRAAALATDDRYELWLDGVKYLFVTAIEACIDVAQHICSSEGYGAPDTNAAAVRELARRGVIDEALGDSLGRAVGFRNVLVHQYVAVDDDIVLSSLDDIHQLHDFVRQVSHWMTATS